VSVYKGILVLALLLSSVSFSQKLLSIRGETLSFEAAKKKFGTLDYSSESFKRAGLEQRSKMAASIVQQKSNFIGLDRTTIRKRLGDYSGFYVSGMYPTYLIQETSETINEAWQLVFLIDINGKVSDVIIHKNCCND
jgi:hypothetical protein